MIQIDLNVEKVVDKKIKKILQARIEEYGSAKLAFSNIEENPIWLNKEKGIQLKRVSIYGISNAQALHEKRDKDGNIIYDKNGQSIPVDFVNTGNNHHVAIYKHPALDKQGLPKYDDNGQALYELEERVVSFYEAVTRANLGYPIIDKNYRKEDAWEFLFTMKQNEYFVFPNEKTGFNPKDIDLMDPDNYAQISPNLFRVQTMSKVQYGNSVIRDYKFRHHLETSVQDVKELKDVAYKQYKTLSFVDLVIKVRVNHIGQIVSVGE